MRYERKETLSPTLIQSLTQTKSPLTAFGEGLMKVGETNQKIHDTIWEHDLREERRERERLKFAMEQEAHDIKMRQDEHTLEMAERYDPAKIEAGIANTRANTANIQMNTRNTREHLHDFLNKNAQEEADSAAIAKQFYDAYGNLLPEGETYLANLEVKLYDTTLSPAQRRDALNERVRFDINRGRRLGNLSAQKLAEKQWTDEELAALDFLGISPQLFKYQNGTLHGVNKIAQNQLMLLNFVKDNLATLTALRNGEVKLNDLDKTFQDTFMAYAQTYRDAMPNSEKYRARRKVMAETAKLLEQSLDNMNNVKASIGLIDNLMHKLQSYTGGTKPSENAIRILHSFYVASRTKEFYGGNASENDRKSISEPIGTMGQDDVKVMQNILTLLKNDIDAVALDIDGANPIVSYAKYGKEYAQLASLRDLIERELKLNSDSQVSNSAKPLSNY